MEKVKHKVVYQVKGGTWENKTKDPIIEYVEDNGKLKNIPTYMRNNFLHRSHGSWDKDPKETNITEDTVFTFKFKLEPLFPLIASACLLLLLVSGLLLSSLFKPKQEPLTVLKNDMVAVRDDINYDGIDTVPGDQRDPNYNDEYRDYNDPSAEFYTITFVNADGNVLQRGTYRAGDYPSYIGTPVYPFADAEHEYSFAGWQPSITAVTGSATYLAKFTKGGSTPTAPSNDPQNKEPEKSEYTITVNANNPTMGYTDGSGTYEENEIITISATANSGYRFVEWDDGSTINPRTVTVTKDQTYTAMFKKDINLKKGDIININNIFSSGNNANGYRFRVLEVNGYEVKLLALFNTSEQKYYDPTQKFDPTSPYSNVYESSYLDNYLNNTWYNSLSESMKHAIIPTDIVVNTYKYSIKPDSPTDFTGGITYKSQYYSTTAYSNATLTASSTIKNRNVYALDLKDIYDYIGKNVITSNELKYMFFETTSEVNSNVWLRSAEAGNISHAWAVAGNYPDDGNLCDYFVGITSEFRPAFIIDLSNISYSIE